MRYGLAEQAGIIVEGACDRFFGRPSAANPYSEDYAEQAWSSWLFGWQNADWFIDVRGQEEARRWLADEAA